MAGFLSSGLVLSKTILLSPRGTDTEGPFLPFCLMRKCTPPFLLSLKRFFISPQWSLSWSIPELLPLSVQIDLMQSFSPLLSRFWVFPGFIQPGFTASLHATLFFSQQLQFLSVHPARLRLCSPNFKLLLLFFGSAAILQAVDVSLLSGSLSPRSFETGLPPFVSSYTNV